MIESPNKSIGRSGYRPEAIVIHITDGNFAGAKSWLMNHKSQVSAHFIIDENGKIEQLVSCDNTAWHAGLIVKPTWTELKPNVNPNLYTIGIEVAGFPAVPVTLNQFQAVARLVRELCKKYGIQIDTKHVIPHYAIRGDKTCPGHFLDCGIICFLANLRQ